MKPFNKLTPKQQEKYLKKGAKMFIRDFAETLNRLKNN